MCTCSHTGSVWRTYRLFMISSRKDSISNDNDVSNQKHLCYGITISVIMIVKVLIALPCTR